MSAGDSSSYKKLIPHGSYARRLGFSSENRTFAKHLCSQRLKNYILKILNHLTVIGGGSWATALVKIFSESQVQVKWYLRSPAYVDHVKEHGRNPNYLSFLQLKMEHIAPTADLEEAIGFAEHVLFAVPSAYLEDTITWLDPAIMTGRKLLVSIKGIVPQHGQIPSDFLGRFFGTAHHDQAVLGGPCHAEEIALERKTYMTVAAQDAALAAQIAGSVQAPYVKTIVNDDPQGVEICAILKNVIGIACGIASGLNYGDNFQAVLVANAMREMRQFLSAMDGQERDLSHSVYFGDLLVTAYSTFSRNRTFGQMIGRGYSIQSAQLQMNMVAEGYYAVNGIYAMARKLQVDMPVTSAVYRVLYNRISPYVEFKLLENKLL